MGWWSLTCLAALAACGRIGFDGTADPPGDSSSAGDTPGGSAGSDAGAGDAAGSGSGSGAGIAFVGSPIQHTGPMGASDSTALKAVNAGDAILVMVACAGSQTPSSVTVSAPGWTFFQLAPVTVDSGGQVYGAAYGAIAPNTTATTLSMSWTGGNCNRGSSILADELTNNDPTGNSVTFDATSASSGAGNCTTSLTTAHDRDAVWAGCYAATSLTGPGPGYIKSAADSVGDFAEYKLTNDPANTAESVTFLNPNGYVIVAATIKPR